MRTPASNRKTLVSLWLPIAVLCLGVTFLVFIYLEYQRNTSLIEQNRNLISSSTKTRLITNIVNHTPGRNWSNADDEYAWVKHPPTTYWFQQGKQIFPWSRPQEFEPKSQTKNWENVWSELDSLSTATHVNPERLLLLKSIKMALDTDDESAIQRSFNAYLEHKNAYYLSPQQEIAFSLKLVEIGAKKHWSSELVHAILVTGGNSESPLIRPVTDVLFRNLEAFSHSDFDWINNEVRKSLETFNLPSYFLNEYLSHLNQPRYSLTNIDGNRARSQYYVTSEGWLLHQMPNDLISALPISLDLQLKKIESEFVELGVLSIGDSLTSPDAAGDIPLDDIAINVDKAQLSDGKRRQLQYLVIKSIMLIAFMALILLTLRLIEKNQQRQFAYLALKEDFIKLVSHELKTPLAGIRAMAETLRKRIQRKLSVESYPERIINEADKLWYMVDNILGFNRVQANDAVIKQHSTQLKTLCDSVVNDVRSFSTKPYVVSNNIIDSVNVLVDPSLFSLVVKNILVNAGLYNQNTTVEINLNYNEDRACLIISDNGIGIAESDQEKIFKPFVRLDQSVRQSGTGLGLAICKRIMQLHNGDLSIGDSNERGSQWEVTFTD